jgi:hypothetical protein
MKTYKKILHYWIAIASALSFLGGWIILAHSPKPVETTTTQPATPQSAVLPTLAPLPALNNSTSQGSTLNNSQANPQFSTGMPLLRTRGS